MKTGVCPACNHRMVLVHRRACDCPITHRPVWQACPTPRQRLVVRSHDCGRGLTPRQVQDLASTPERKLA
jgi:uncharacterized protein YbaR (Trm112 family)